MIQELGTKTCYILFGSNPLLVSAVYSLFIVFVFFISKKINNKTPVLFIVSIIPALLYAVRLLLNDYFLSDDFDHFVLSSKYSFGEIFVKGIMADNIWAFRRLFTAVWMFKFIYTIFGTNYYAYVAFNLILHISNTYLFFRLINKINKNIYITSFVTFLFSSFYLTWISNIHELAAAFFFLSAFILCFNWVLDHKKENRKLILLSVVVYILGIFSKEVTFLFPVVFSLFLIFYSNHVKRIDLTKAFKKLKSFYFLFVVFLGVFIFDYYKFSGHETGSGYDTVYKITTYFNHLSFYLSDRIPLIYGLTGLITFVLLIVLYDVYYKKLVLIPIFVSFVMLLTPILFLSKATPYYLYIPNIFLLMIIAVLVEKIYVKHWIMPIVLALLLVFVFKQNKNIQENCFLIQFPRTHPRKVVVEQLVKKAKNGLEITQNDLNSSEAKDFMNNGYLKYFLNTK